MSWSPLAPHPTAAQSITTATVVAATTPGGSRVPSALVLTLRTALLDGVTWLQPGTRVQVLKGSGEHVGMLRLEPAGPFAVQKPGGRFALKNGPVLIRMPLPPGVAPGARKPTAVDFDYADGWIEMTLPAAWREPADVAPPAPAEVKGPSAEPRSVTLAREAAALAVAKAGRRAGG